VTAAALPHKQVDGGHHENGEKSFLPHTGPDHPVQDKADKQEQRAVEYELCEVHGGLQITMNAISANSTARTTASAASVFPV
jgi:hypothetical protein